MSRYISILAIILPVVLIAYHTVDSGSIHGQYRERMLLQQKRSTDKVLDNSELASNETEPVEQACPVGMFICSVSGFANPCMFLGCPGIPLNNRECEVLKCGYCRPSYTKKDTGEVATIDECCGQALVEECPDEFTCDPKDCSRYPESECRVTKCGSCVAEFYVDNIRVTDFCEHAAEPSELLYNSGY